MSTQNTQSRFRYVSPWMIILSLVWLLVFLLVFPDPAGLAAKYWPLLFVGVAGAFIGNITAIGGGLVFIPVLMLVYQTDAVSALKLAFVSQAIGMTSGASGWIRRGEVPFPLLKWTVPSLLLGTVLSTFVFHPSGMLVKSLFGPVSLLAGLLTLFTLDRKGALDSLPAKAFLPVFAVSVIGGLITGWVSIGEGEVVAAFCMLGFGLKATRAIGLGVTLLSINSIVLALIHSLYFGGVPWEMAIFTMGGVLWGGRLGPYLGQYISIRDTKKIFAWIAILDGLLISWQSFRNLMK